MLIQKKKKSDRSVAGGRKDKVRTMRSPPNNEITFSLGEKDIMLCLLGAHAASRRPWATGTLIPTRQGSGIPAHVLSVPSQVRCRRGPVLPVGCDRGGTPTIQVYSPPVRPNYHRSNKGHRESDNIRIRELPPRRSSPTTYKGKECP